MHDVAAIARPRLDTGPWPGRTGMTTYSGQVDSPHASQSHDLRATHISVSPSRGAAHAGTTSRSLTARAGAADARDNPRTVRRRFPSVGEREMLPGCRR